MDGFVGVTVVLRAAVLLLYRVVSACMGSFLWCVAVVCPHGLVGFFILDLFSPDIIPAPRWHSLAYH